MKLFKIFALVAISFTRFSGLLLADAANPYELDFLKERVRTVHGDFSMKIQGEWRASLEGRTESWRWTGQNWKCGTKTETLSCEAWKVFGFDLLGKNFWTNWSPVKRIDFDIIKAKVEAKRQQADKLESSEDVSSPEAAHVVPLWSKNIIGERWLWNSSKGEELKTLISARDSRIERIEFGDRVEAYEWAFVGAKKTLELTKVVLEKNGVQVVLSKLK
jgi:hypothetical protein